MPETNPTLGNQMEPKEGPMASAQLYSKTPTSPVAASVPPAPEDNPVTKLVKQEPGETMMISVLRSALSAKQGGMLFDNEIKNATTDLQKAALGGTQENVNELKKMRAADAIQAVQSDINRHLTQISYLDKKRSEVASRVDTILNGVADNFSSQLSALGITPQDLGLEPVKATTSSPSYSPSTTTTRRTTTKPKSTGTTGTTGTKTTGGTAYERGEQYTQMEQDILASQELLDSGLYTWGEVWNTLAGLYPELTVPDPDTGVPMLDKALGGGQYPGTNDWWGRAVTTRQP